MKEPLDRSGDWHADVVELRQYTLHPGQRDTLIELFDRELVETQEAVGMTVIGQFGDRDDRDRFVWLRGFEDMTARQTALEAFYDGPVWAAYGRAAAATMVDSDDVLLLRPLDEHHRIRPTVERPPPAATGDGPGVVIVDIVLIEPDDLTTSELGDAIVSALTDAGTDVLGAYETEPARNTFRRLPVREADTAIVWLTGFPDDRAHRAANNRLAAIPNWAQSIAPLLRRPSVRSVSSLRLVPTARSRIVGGVDPP